MANDLGTPRDTVGWEALAMKLFVNRYIRTRQQPVNNANRRLVEGAVCRYPGRFPALRNELEQFLDSHLLMVRGIA